MSGNKKISQLPNATALTGVELLPIVQNSETRNSVLDDLATYINSLIPATDWALAGNTLTSAGIIGAIAGNYDITIKRNNVTQILFDTAAVNIKKDTIITGSGNTSATKALSILDSALAEIGFIRNDGAMFVDRIIDSSETHVVADFSAHTLYYAGDPSIEWGTRLLKDSGTYNSLNWNSRVLGDSLGVNALNWSARTLNDQNGNASLYWEEDGVGIGGNDFGGGTYCMFMRNAYIVPTTNPTGGGIIYCDAGALKYRSPNGTVTIMGVL